MQFSELTTYFEQLDGTSSRLELIDILSKLFADSDDAEEIAEICYLVQGRIAPFYMPIELGLAEKYVAEAISRASYDLHTKEEVLLDYEKIGDLGEVAEKIAKKNLERRVLKPGNLTVHHVFEHLTSIAGISGNGAIKSKLDELSKEDLDKLKEGERRALFRSVDPISIKYLVRIMLGKLRLGIGDPTVLDALLTAKLGDKKQRKVAEGAYNRTSDLGYIGKTLWKSGLEAVEKLDVTVGRPIRSELCERLPNPTKVIEKMEVVDSQYKYDGFRVQIHKDGEHVRIFSRNLEEMTHMFPELIEGTLTQVKAKTAILDGEAIAYNPESDEFLPFQETTKRRRKHNIEETAKELPLKAFIFDMLYKDGKSMLDNPLTSRLATLKETIQGSETLLVSYSEEISEPEKLQVMLDDAFSKGLEGLVIKRLDSPYEAGGRNFNWVKLKKHSSGELHDTIDCVIIGYIYGKGKRAAFGAGALLVAVYDKKEDQFVSVTRIGTGLTDDEWRSIKEKAHGLEMDHKPARVHSWITPSVWVKPEIVIEVLADEITRSPLHTAGAAMDERVGKELGYALRFPRLVSFRDKDKKAEDATSVDELIEMFNAQGKKD